MLSSIIFCILFVLVNTEVNNGQQKTPNKDQLMNAIETSKLSPDDINKIAQALKTVGPSILQLADHMDKQKRSIADDEGADWIFVNSEKTDGKDDDDQQHRKARGLDNLDDNAITHLGKSNVDKTLFHSKRYCGYSPRRSDPTKLSNTSPGQYPFAAAILSEDDSFLCSGTLISESIVLTTASCVLKYRAHGQAVKVVLGAWSLPEGHPHPPELQVFVRTAVLHPSYIPNNPQTFIHDVGLLRLSENVDFDLHPHVFPICIVGTKHVEAAGTKGCLVLGWPELPGMETWRSSVYLTAGEVSIQTSGCPSGSGSPGCLAGHACVGNQGSAVICLASSQRYYQWGILLNEPNCDRSSTVTVSAVSVIDNHDFIQKHIWTPNPVSA